MHQCNGYVSVCLTHHHSVISDKYFARREMLAARYIIGIGAILFALYALVGHVSQWLNVLCLFPLACALGGMSMLHLHMQPPLQRCYVDAMSGNNVC
jgi:sugar phosphate permease